MENLNNMIISLREFIQITIIVAILSGVAHLTSDIDFIFFFLGALITALALNSLEKIYRLHQYVRGANDCEKGIPHREGMTREYDEGYGFQYAKEQMESARSDK